MTAAASAWARISFIAAALTPRRRHCRRSIAATATATTRAATGCQNRIPYFLTQGLPILFAVMHIVDIETIAVIGRTLVEHCRVCDLTFVVRKPRLRAVEYLFVRPV